MRYLFLFTVCLYCISLTGRSVSIMGQVVSNTGKLEHAVVKLKTNDTLVQYTDNDGRFSFFVEARSEGEIEVSYAGNKTYHRRVSLLENIFLEIRLESETLEEIVVTAKSKALLRTEASGEMYMNTQKMTQIPSFMGTPDLIKILQLMPGVQNSGEANGYLYVRGADPGHNLMQYAGAPIYGMSHLLGLFPFYNTDHIEQIKFDKVGSQAKNGNRLSSTIQAFTPERVPEAMQVKGNIGLLASQLGVAVPLNPQVGFILSGRKTYIDQFITPLINSGSQGGKGKIEKLSYNLGDINFSGVVEATEKHLFTLNAFVSDDRFKIREEEMLLDGSLIWDNHTFSGSWQYLPSKEIKFRQTAYYTRYSNRLVVNQASVDVSSRSTVADFGLNSDLEFQLYEVPIQAGVQFSYYEINPQHIFSFQLGLENNNNNNEVVSNLLSVYMQANPNIFKCLNMDVGFRINTYSSRLPGKKTFFSIEPRISFNYIASTGASLSLTYARKNQFLNLITTSSVGFPTDFWLAASNEIPFQYSDNFSVSGTHTLFNNIKMDIGAFYNQMHRLLEYPFSILQFNQINNFGADMFIGDGVAYGGEVMFRKTGRLSGWLSYTLSKSERKFEEINEGKPYPAKFDRRHNLSLVLNYQISKKWNAGFTQIYSSGSRFTAASSWYFISNNPVKEYGKLNDAKMPDYIRTDISVDYFLKKTAKKESVLNLSIYNMFAVVNPIYTSMRIESGKGDSNAIKVGVRYTKLYTILPSISWRFKF